MARTATRTSQERKTGRRWEADQLPRRPSGPRAAGGTLSPDVGGEASSLALTGSVRTAVDEAGELVIALVNHTG